nr:MAG TPA: hypothetical protein [Caudoviricetes sp.]
MCSESCEHPLFHFIVKKLLTIYQVWYIIKT